MGKKKSSSHKAKRSLSRLPKGLPVRGGGVDPTANPFEQGGPQRRPKQFVHNRGVIAGTSNNNSARGRGGGPSSLLLALQQRQQVVQAERQASKKSNVFFDRRLTASTPQEQALQRLVKERHSVGSKRQSKFRLGDDHDGDDDGDAMLTHRGKAINELSAADHVILSDTEEDYGHLEQLDTDLHFGGGTLGGGKGGSAGNNPYGPSGTAADDANQLALMSNVYSRRKTELDDLIVRRKLAKAERLQLKEEQVETFDKFDENYKELAGLLQFRDKRKTYATDVDDEMAEWDREMNTLLLKRRVAATDRTKTEEEVAKEEADRLHELETKRLARMNGDFDDDDLSDVSVGDATAGGVRNKQQQKRKHAEALDDDFDDEDGGVNKNTKKQYSMKFTADGLVKVDSQGNVVKESETTPGDSVSPSIIHSVGTRVSVNYHAAEQLEGYSAWYEGVVKRVHTNKDGAVTYDVDYDDGDFEEGVQPQHVRPLDEDNDDAPPAAVAASTSNFGSDDKTMKLKRQKAKEQARSSIPFVFEVPTTLDALHDMIATHAKTGEDASLIIRRIHVANSVKLDRRNSEKMQNFYDVLLRRLVAVGDAIYHSGDGGPELGRFKQLDSITSVLYLMAQDSGDSAAAVWGRRLGFFQSAHAKRLRDAELLDNEGDDAPSTAWPSTGVFLALRALGHVFPVTDRRHHVVTPAILFLGQVLSHTPIESMSDLAMGLLFTGLLIEYNKEAKRIVPEALAFLGGVLRLFAPELSDRAPDLFSHPALGAATSIEPLVSIRESAVSLVVDEESSLPRLPLQKEFIDRTPSCAMAVLGAALELVTAYANALPTCAREGFAEIASALCTLQPRHKTQPLPKTVWNKLSTAVAAIERHEEAATARPPLQRRSAPTVVSIKSLAPRLDSVTSSKKRSRNDGNAVTTALRHELQRETKAAKRELQWDATLVEQLRRTEQAKRDEAAASKRHRAFAWLEQQQGELNQQVRQGGGLLKGGGVGAARAKARTGKLGMKKGGKL